LIIEISSWHCRPRASAAGERCDANGQVRAVDGERLSVEYTSGKAEVNEAAENKDQKPLRPE
jgi:hypothetical protein